MNPNSLILFDGVCNFCNYWVNFAIKYNPKKDLFFSPLQSDYAQQQLVAHHVGISNLSSVVFIHNNKVYTQSSAALAICKHLQYPYRAFYIFIVIPKFIRDFVYNIIAKNRYRWFGKANSCIMPTAELKQRFL